MAIDGFNEEKFTDLLARNLTPSDHISTPERLFGRAKELQQIRRTFASASRQVFIFGDRGVGKSSLALTAAHLQNSSLGSPLYVACDDNDTFGSIVRQIGRSTIPAAEKFAKNHGSSTLSAGIAGIGGSKSVPASKGFEIPEPKTISEAYEVIEFVVSRSELPLIIIIDELERIRSREERGKFSSFIKNSQQINNKIRFIFCGIQITTNELLEAHPSAGRAMESINVDPISFDARWDIVRVACEKLGVSVPHHLLVRIGQICDGFPHFAHLIGESLLYRAFYDNENVTEISDQHFNLAIDKAVKRAEPELIGSYEKAILKPKHSESYREVLWAMADRSVDTRPLGDVYTQSYLPVMKQRRDREPLDRKAFNRRLLALKQPGHGEVLVSRGPGNYGFREKRFRAFVRMDAEEKGIEIGRHD